MRSLADCKRDFYALRDSYMRQDARHIEFSKEGTILYASDKDKVYVPTPTGERFHDSREFVNLVIGPYGSGKSTMCVQHIVRSTASMPRWDSNGRRRARWAVVRNTSGELYSTTLQTWLAWFSELGDIKRRQKPILTYEHTFNDGHGIIVLELIFIALDRPEDVRKIKSLELTGVYLNELSELPANVLSHFKGRVNGRYPSRSFCSEPYWSGIIADTNPPETDHWIYKDFEEKTIEGYRIFHQPPGLIKDSNGIWQPNPMADNAMNLSHDYYMKLASGQSEDFVKVFCLGQYGSVGTGRRVFPEFNLDIHAVDAIEAIQGDPLHLAWDGGLCYSDDTEVLTLDGWKLFKDVDEHNDFVATRNPKTGNMEYTSINFKVEYDYNGELLEWDSQNVSFCVTPEHRVPFTYRDTPHIVHFKSAEWLSEHSGGHHYVDLCSNWSPEFNEAETYFGMDAHTYAEFMGLYLSEGCVNVNGNSHRISIYQNNQDTYMQDVLDRTGLNWVYSFKGNCGVWCVTNNQLGPYLTTFGKAGDKFVPSEIKSMPPKLIKAFIYAYTKGDGHIMVRKNGSVEHTIRTISDRMKDDLQELAQKAGWYSSISRLKPRVSTIIENGIPRLITNNGIWNITFKKRAQRAELLKRNFRKVPYKGKIYCLNVPYHVLYIRRNGKPSWNGNTPACIVVQMSPRGQLRVLKEFIGEDMGIRTFAESVVLPGLKTEFPYCKIGSSVFDPSGAARDNILEETSCIGELNSLGIKTEPAKTNELEPRLGAVRFFLNRMIDGKPSFVVSRKKCPQLIKGLVKDYVYKRLAVSGEERYKDKPDKNMSSHICDALQYVALEFAADRIAKDKAPVKPVEMFNPTFRWQN